MRIELFPGNGCLIREVVGNLHELKTIGLGETVLILVSKLIPDIQDRL